MLWNNKIKSCCFLCVIMLMLAGCADSPAENTQSQIVKTEIVTDSNGNYIIDKAGEYHLSGNIDGTVLVDAGGDSEINLILENAYITAKTGPAINIKSAGKVTITAPEGTENSIKDAAGYNPSEKATGCIYSVCDLDIDGPGTINIYGYHKNGISCKDIVRINDVNIYVLAKKDGIKANDGIYMNVTSAKIETEEDGLVTEKEGKNDKGKIELSGGDFSIISGKYGISARTDLDISNCTLFIKGLQEGYVYGENGNIDEACIVNE